MKKRYILYLALFLGLFFGFSQYLVRAKASHEQCAHYLPTYYTYPKQQLQDLCSQLLITHEQWDKWEKILASYMEENEIKPHIRFRFYTYLYMVQRDAAFLSYNTHLCFLGSLDPITIKLTHAFFPDFPHFPEIETDAYSEQLAKIVFSQYSARLDAEEENVGSFNTTCEASDYALETLSWIPWVEPEPHICPPPSPENRRFWNDQMSQLQNIQKHLTPEQREQAVGWNTHRNWRQFVNTYMEECCTPFAKALLVRSSLMMGAYDAFSDSYRGKYTFCTKRPYQYDPEFKPIIKAPKSPSYPSAASSTAWAVVTILSHFFPQDCGYWEKMGRDAADSRMWGGVHFPIDIEMGRTIGITIGEQVIECSH